jgi:hypothetical protein
LLTTPTILKLTEQRIVRLQLCKITCAADVLPGASKRDIQSHMLSGDNNFRLSTVYRMLRPTLAVSEGLIRLADAKRPEANQLIELRRYTLQHHTRIAYNEDVS